MKNKFPYHTLFSIIPTYFEMTAKQTLFIVRSLLYFCLHRAPRMNTEHANIFISIKKLKQLVILSYGRLCMLKTTSWS